MPQPSLGPAPDLKDAERGSASPYPVVANTKDSSQNSSSASSFRESRRPFLDKAIGRAQAWGVLESRGIAPAPLEERTDTNFYSLFSLWFSMSFSVLPIVTGMVGPLYGLSLRDSALVILFFSLLGVTPAAYFATLGPRSGMRQMIQSRYAFGLYGNMLPVVLNAATVTGFCILNSILGGQTLAAVSDNKISWNVGIVILGVVSFVATVGGYRVLHLFDRFAWIPTTVAILVAVGCGGDKLHLQVATEPATAPAVLSFGALIAGYMIPWAGLSSDFCTYMHPSAPRWRIFSYVYGGLIIPSVPLMTLGAAIGATVPRVPSWSAANDMNSAGGVLAEMLKPAGGFGKFCVVLLAFSVMANIVGSLYSISLNCQMFLPVLIKVPRPFFVLMVTAVLIPVAIEAAKNFYDSLENFVSVISYWSAAWVAIYLSEYIIFRKRNVDNMDPSIFQDARQLPTGVPAVLAGCLSAALFIPSMAQTWYTGPIAEYTGDIGFEMAFAVSLLCYVPLRALEIKIRGRL